MQPSIKKPWDNGILKVTENRRYLTNGDKPFFWLGDTAWLLFQNLNLEQCYTYLKNRVEKGFNVIQATLVHTLPGADLDANSLPVNRNNIRCALVGRDFAQPDIEGGFWDHVDAVVSMAEDLGIYMGLLPAWGAMAKQGLLNEQNAEAYGRFLAERYGSRRNVIWLIGGDVRGSDAPEVFELLARTIKKAAPKQIMGYHPFGRTSSSLWFDSADWLDFNMYQSGHRRYDQKSLGAWDDNAGAEDWFGEDSWRYVKRDYSAKTKRPTIDGEPSYEQIPQGLHDPRQPYWQDYDVRRYAWWSVLEGAFGHTYGHNAIMQFHQEGDSGGSYGVNAYWHEAIHAPGAGQMQHMVNFMSSLDFTTGVAAENLLTNPRAGYTRVSAFSGNDFAVFYTYMGYGFGVNLPELGWDSADFWWFDPALGVMSYAGKLECEQAEYLYPPKKPFGHNDWILLLKKSV